MIKIDNPYPGRFETSHERCPVCYEYKKDFIHPESGKLTAVPCNCELHLHELRDTLQANKKIYPHLFSGAKEKNYLEEQQSEWLSRLQNEIFRIERIMWENKQSIFSFEKQKVTAL